MKNQEIRQFLQEKHNSFANVVNSLPEADFLYAPPGKWSSGQQLDHVRRSVRPLVLALRLPKGILRLLFGTANRPSKSYEELVQKYQSKLEQAVTPPAPFRPDVIAFQGRNTVQTALQTTVRSVINALEHWSEEDLDRYILPHPLLGKITVREMMYFTIYHAQHHENLVKSYLAKR